MTLTAETKQKWQTKKLGGIISLEYGKPLLDSLRDSSGLYPVYGANGIKDRTNEFQWDKPSIIVGRKGSAGEINITESKFWPLDVTYFIKFDDELYNLRFLYYLLKTLNLPQLARGVKPGINRNEVYSIEVCVPESISEQHRIVSILDEAFTEIDKAKVITGKNLRNAKEVLEGKLESVFSNVSKDWTIKRLEEITNIEYGYTEKAKDKGDYRYIRITDIDKEGNLEPENKMFIEYSKEAEKFALEDGDLLMARTGATFGKVLLYRDIEKSVFASYLIKISFKENILNKLYWYFSKSRIYWRQASNLSSGAAQPQFNGSALREIIFSFPSSLTDQHDIITELDAISEETKKLEKLYRSKLTHLEELKKSILKQAFEGKL
jgi:type I restriction enzyme S subunit